MENYIDVLLKKREEKYRIIYYKMRLTSIDYVI